MTSPNFEDVFPSATVRLGDGTDVKVVLMVDSPLNGFYYAMDLKTRKLLHIHYSNVSDIKEPVVKPKDVKLL